MTKTEQSYKDIVDADDELTGFKSGTCFYGKDDYHIKCQESLRLAKNQNSKAEAYFETLRYKPVNVANHEFKKAEQRSLCNPVIKRFYRKLAAAIRSKKVAITTCIRKFIANFECYGTRWLRVASLDFI